MDIEFDIKKFYEQFLSRLQSVQEKIQMDMLTIDFSRFDLYPAIIVDTSEQKKQIAQLLREKCYNILLQEGETFEKDYIYFYAFFVNNDIPIDERFLPFVKIAQAELKRGNSLEESSEEAVLIDLIAIGLIFAGDTKKGLFEYIHGLSTIHFLDAIILDRIKLVMNFFTKSNIQFEEVQECLTSLFEPDFFFSLSAIQKRSVFVWTLHQWWNVPQFLNHLGWLHFYPQWKALFYRVLEEDRAFAVYLQFIIYHFMGNSFHTQEEWKMFNDEITKRAEPYYIDFGKSLTPCKKEMSTGKKIIAIIKDRVVENSPFKVEYSFLKALLDDNEMSNVYTIKVYLLGFVEKSNDDPALLEELKKCGIEVVDVVSDINVSTLYACHLQRALAVRERIIADGVDILISPNNGYGISDFILATRSAPLQIFWSHGNEAYDIEGIDKRISHIQLTTYFKFQTFTIPMDTQRFYNPPVTQEAIFVERSKYPKNKIILGVIGRLVKVEHEDFLKCIAHVLKKNPETIFIAAGHGNYQALRAKVEALGISKEQFFMPGHVDAHVYGHIIDIFCNTFPLEQGESLDEFIYKGRAWINLAKDGYYQKFQEACFEQELIDLKYSNQTLVYVEHLERYNENVKNWYEFFDGESGEYSMVLLYHPKDKQYIQKMQFKNAITLEVQRDIEELMTLADMCGTISNNEFSWNINHRFEQKSVFHTLPYFYDQNLQYRVLNTEFVYQKPDIFQWGRGGIVQFYTYAYTAEKYEEYLTQMIRDKTLRKGIGISIGLQMEHICEVRKQLFIADVKKIFEG